MLLANFNPIRTAASSWFPCDSTVVLFIFVGLLVLSVLELNQKFQCDMGNFSSSDLSDILFACSDRQLMHGCMPFYPMQVQSQDHLTFGLTAVGPVPV